MLPMGKVSNRIETLNVFPFTENTMDEFYNHTKILKQSCPLWKAIALNWIDFTYFLVKEFENSVFGNQNTGWQCWKCLSL